MMITEFDKLKFKGKSKDNPEMVIKTSGHCVDGCQWQMCDFWWVDGNKVSRCSMFGNTVKFGSESINICNKMYGFHYEGKA